MKNFLRNSTLIGLTMIVGGCSTSPNPVPERLPTMSSAVQQSALRFAQDSGRPGIVRVAVPRSDMRVGTTFTPVSPSLRNRPIKLMVPQEATLTDVVSAIQSMGITVVFKWKNGDKTDVLNKKPPFTKFDGSFGALLDALRRGAGIVSWQEGEVVYISDADRFSITLPQDQDIITDAASQLTALGAVDVVTSLEGGTIIYTATPDLQTDVIAPFVSRLIGNLSTVNLQVAIVSLAVNDKLKEGFDWNAFSLAVAEPKASTPTTTPISQPTGPATGTGSEAGGTDGNTGGGSTVGGGTGIVTPPTGTSDLDNAVRLLSSGVGVAQSFNGELFGKKVVTSVTAAIDFLSTFGNTNVTQNVDLRTISGKPVKFHSGQEIPYVRGVSNTTTQGTSSTTGSTDTDTVQTGLTVEMTPRFDSSSGVVTVTLNLDLTSVVEFVQLNAGNQIGTLTQPRTQTQKLEDIVRLQAGQTVVLGGLQYDQETFAGTEPSFLRDRLRSRNRSLGSRSNDTVRQALFVIMRPSVTVYEASDFGFNPVTAGLLK